LLGIFFSKSWKRRAMCVVSGLALLLLLPLAQSNGQLRIEFLDVGQGDATLLRFPGGQNLLIDCGSAEAARFELIPSFRRRGIDRIHNLLISHFDVDHAGGALELLEALRVDRILVGMKFPETVMGKAVLELAETKNILIRTLCFGDTIAGIHGALALVLWPPRSYQADDNRCSIVLKIRYAESDLLFTGDINTREEKFLLAGGEILQSELLKVAHHGSKYSSGRTFLEVVSPDVAVISCGRRNPYGHPTPRVLRDLHQIGVDVHRTDTEYAGVFASDGTSIREVSWR
jgi:beta-lactamase superfamily II metal-dependent hydrolase